MKIHKINKEIKSKEIILIDENNGQQQVSFFTALDSAKLKDLDLVQIGFSKEKDLPVCKFMNYGKFSYEQTKKLKEQKKNSQKISIKEIQISPNIDKHDLETKKNYIINFINDKCKVKIVMKFKGRQITHMERGIGILKSLEESLKEFCVLEKPLEKLDKNIILYFIHI
jgi:translation initiation factor IF-3